MYKIKLFLSFCFISINSYAVDCIVTITPSSQSEKDCIVCKNEIRTPSDKVANLVNPIVGFVTDSAEQKQKLDRLKGYALFLNNKSNMKSCDNYKSLVEKFNKDFQKELVECEKGIDLLERKKIVCEWVLNTYNGQIVDSFYRHWSLVKPDGKVEFIAGRTMEQLEMPIRSQHNWCKKAQKAFKSKVFIHCGDLDRWVEELNISKRVSESMKRDMNSKNEKSNSESDRKSMLDQACQYFENNAATTFTKDLYLNCLDR